MNDIQWTILTILDELEVPLRQNEIMKELKKRGYNISIGKLNNNIYKLKEHLHIERLDFNYYSNKRSLEATRKIVE